MLPKQAKCKKATFSLCCGLQSVVFARRLTRMCGMYEFMADL